jgi:hypothetical protein
LTGSGRTLLGAVLLVALSLGSELIAQRPAQEPLPPISYACPHHPDVIESRAGKCPLCGFALAPQRLDSEWMCPVHSVVHQNSPGACRLCRRTLVPVTMTLTWTCRGEADVEHIDPGPCKDGTPRLAKRTLRAHGNHNPQHGGQFFMAPDNWHHLEGTYPRDRTVRIYIYDDYARPLGSRRMKDVQGRVVTRERFDPATKQTTELKSFALKASRDGTYLEARIDPAKLPMEVTAKLKLSKDAPEYRFDFTFREVTRDPNQLAPVAPTTARAIGPTTVNPVGPTSAAAIGPTSEGAIGPTSEAPIAPVMDRFQQLRAIRTEIEGLITRGEFGAIWVPAFAAKDLAVELEAERADPALRDLVRASWRLDAVGDAGNRQDIEQAFRTFTDALGRTLEAFGR